MKKNYIALIGDIVGSKKIEDRYDFQERFKEIIASANQKYKNELASPLTITLGDEFQALCFINSDKIFEIIDYIRLELENVDVRFGLGVGEIITAINPKVSLGADGPAYWCARQAVIQSRASKKSICIVHQLVDNIDLNPIVDVTEQLFSQMTATQKKVLKCIIKLDIFQDNFSNNRISREMNISPSALSKRLKSGNIKNYISAKKTINLLIRK